MGPMASLATAAVRTASRAGEPTGAGTTAMANSTGATAEFVFDGSSVTLVGSLNGPCTGDGLPS